MITEVLTAGTAEFVELYDPNEKELSLNGLYLVYFSADRDWGNPYPKWQFLSTSTIPSIKS